jgi:peroxiredoxin
MPTTKLNHEIPDIDLPWTAGGTMNPSSLAGHQLVVLFLPEDLNQQLTELKSYERVADQLSRTDAWVLAIGGPRHDRAETDTPIALDPDGQAWGAFKGFAADAKLDRAAGAVFFFTRGGACHRVWAGPGQAPDVVQELLSRS